MQQRDFGVIQKVCSLKFSTCFPHVYLCSFYMQNAYEFLNETFRSEKGEKKFFVVNST